MTAMASSDYEQILDLAVSVLESTDGIPWPLITGTLRDAIGIDQAVIFYSRDWFDHPPADYPLPSDIRGLVWNEFDDALDAHPLLAHLGSHGNHGPGLASTDDLPRNRRLPADEAHRHTLERLGTLRHLAFALPAPPGSRQALIMGLPDGPLQQRQLELCVTVHPLLTAIARHERHLELLTVSRPLGLDPQARAREHRITPRELTVLQLLAQALTADAIARRLGTSSRTINNHLQSLYRKLDTTDRLAAVLRAQYLGILPPPGDNR